MVVMKREAGLGRRPRRTLPSFGTRKELSAKGQFGLAATTVQSSGHAAGETVIAVADRSVVVESRQAKEMAVASAIRLPRHGVVARHANDTSDSKGSSVVSLSSAEVTGLKLGLSAAGCYANLAR
jgi:hypothetical protein